jgi:lipopolysaccharide/colanic/teichoic acid biosynthesis glycosyltransferase
VFNKTLQSGLKILNAFDIVGSISIIVILSPALIYISRKVKKDGGPAIYGHERIGKGGNHLSV